MSVARTLEPVVEHTTRTTLASAVVLDGHGVSVDGEDYSGLPEVQAALAGRPRTVLRENGDYRPLYRFEWLSKASGIRLHHARPILVDGRVRGVILLSRSPRALFRGLYEDRGKFAIAAGVILGLLVVLSGLIARGVTLPIETLSAASRQVAGGGGEIPRTPRTAAVEIRDLYEDFRAMAERIERRSGYLRDFAAAVSHEFKTPLAGIRGAVELLQDHFETMSPAERRRFLDNIAGDSDRLSQLVTRLLDLARADMTMPEAGATADLAEPARRTADAAGFPVEVDVPRDVPRGRRAADHGRERADHPAAERPAGRGATRDGDRRSRRRQRDPDRRRRRAGGSCRRPGPTFRTLLHEPSGRRRHGPRLADRPLTAGRKPREDRARRWGQGAAFRVTLPRAD